MQITKQEYFQIQIENVEKLKKPTIYFYLKSNGFSESFISCLRNTINAIKINEQTVTIRANIQNGDILEILKNPKPASNVHHCEGNLDILFEDNDFLIVNKPHNLSCIPSHAHYDMNLGGQICKYMQSKTENFVLRILNRLDRETAGIVVVAKNMIAYHSISLNKEYHAICHGIINKELTINKPILTETNKGINVRKRIISPLGKPAITHIYPIKNHTINTKTKTNITENITNNLNNDTTQKTESTENNDKTFNTNLIDTYGDFSLIKLKLETGRTHQIRVHLSSINHPLFGDTIYGINDNFTHTMLLLKKVSFTHYITGKQIEIEVPYPEEWLFSAK